MMISLMTTRRAAAGALLLLVLAFVGPFARPAAAQSIADCEKIDAPDAYNKCLASYGPKRGHSARLVQEPEGAAETPAATGGRAARRGPARAASGPVQRRAGGRQFAIFEVGQPVRPSARRR
jgi:hypothetical protein